MIYLVYLIYLVYEWGTTKDNKWTRKTHIFFVIFSSSIARWPWHQMVKLIQNSNCVWRESRWKCEKTRDNFTSVKNNDFPEMLRPASNIHRWHASVTNQKLENRSALSRGCVITARNTIAIFFGEPAFKLNSVIMCIGSKVFTPSWTSWFLSWLQILK